ncbi:hypothetical protein F9C07_2284592 [Aspergillus flavus]|uniref:Uncharacterized protein n=3 Tax=Aspergillus subgen. Circumdati TaxID=2720871 RepID=A0A7U2MHJ1_ASPFN|nr:hypothetical protein AFLA_004990 [Aspergillus flavus NRRL3357]QRD83852.1 hypothetical protein F9C07_2284592 [Aspergillus flavus]
MSCYAMHGGKILPNFEADSPCGITNSTNPVVQCCVKGDYCMSHGICRYTHSGASGCYAGDCTDRSLQDPICLTRCGGLPYSDLTYNLSSGLWACCSYYDNDKANCTSPSDEMFAAPAPSDLVVIQYLPSTGTPSYHTARATSTSDITSMPSSNSSGQVGMGAAVGIGVGVGAGVFLIATAGVLFYNRRRRSSPSSTTPTSLRRLWVGPESESHQLQPQRRVELGKSEPRPQELA